MLLTWFRIILIPLFVGVFYVPQQWLSQDSQNVLATWLFCIAGVTDWFDGYLARKWQQTSAFGAFLDPVADKLMVVAALILLVQLGRADALLAMIIIGREITISALREWMASVGNRSGVAVAFIGKLKTTVQMVAIPCLIFKAPLLGLPIEAIGMVGLYLAAGLTLYSMGYYLHVAWPHLKA